MTVTKSASMGGAAANVKIAPIAHGLMMMTWVPTPAPDEQCFEAIKAGIDQLPEGTKMLLNSGEFYAQDLGPGNLEMLSRFFEKYPSYADKTFLSVKGGAKDHSLEPEHSPENLKRSVDAVIKALRGKKHVDLFECARFADDKWKIEDVVQTLKGFVEEGKISYIGVSECSAASLKRAVAVAPIASVEIEVSLWSYEEETKKVIATAKDLGVTVHAYSPIGRGMLTGAFKSPADFKEGDMRAHMTRFQEGNFEHNLKLVEAVSSIARKKGVTPAQLAIAWVRSLGDHVVPLAGSSKKERTLENLQAGEIELSDGEKKEIWEVLEKHEVKGGRYNDNVPAGVLHLWG